MLQQRNGANTGIACQLIASTAGTTQLLRLFDLYAGSSVMDTAHEVIVGSVYMLALARDTDSFTCGATNPTATVTGTSAGGAGALEVGLRARNMAANVAWVLVIQSP